MPAASICQHVCLSLSHVSLGPLGTHQAPLPTEFSRQEYWSGLPFSSPVDLPDPGIELWSPALQADSLLSEPLGMVKYFFFFFFMVESQSMWDLYILEGKHS